MSDSGVYSEALGYFLFIVGLCIFWWKFSFFIALAVGCLLFGVVLILGGYVRVLAVGLHNRIAGD